MKITVEEIARIAGVSKATVSRVLNDSPSGVGPETRRRVQDLIESMGYTNEHTIEPKHIRSKTIALLIPDVTNPYFADIVKAVEMRAKQDDYMVILVNTDFVPEMEREYISKLVAKRVNGFILVSSSSHSYKEYFKPQKYGIPMVLLDRRIDGLEEYPSVCSDNVYASYSACDVLIRKGARSIVFCAGNEGISTSEERMEGYKEALLKHGLPFSDAHIKYGQYTVEGGYNAIIDFEKAGVKYDAVLAANDLMALGAVKAMKELSYKIPEEVQVIGFDNVTFSQLCSPALSTIQQPTVEMGKKAAEMLIEMMDGKKINRNVRLQPRLILRETTK